MSDDEPIPAFCRIPQDERRSAWARWDAKHKEDAVKAGPKEEQIRALRAQQDANRKLKSRGRIEKLKAKLSGATKAMPLEGKAALLKIEAISGTVDVGDRVTPGRGKIVAVHNPQARQEPVPNQETTTMLTETSTATETEPKTTKPAAKKAPAKKAAAKSAKKAAPKKAAKKAASAKKAAAGASAKKAGGVAPGSKTEAVAKLLQRPQGCTNAEVLKTTGWPTVSMPQQAKAAGLTLRKEKVKGEPTRYFGVAKGT
jgi:hypothetical protein